MTNSSPHPKEPTRIGHYDIRDCIGRGGMGLVYLALDTRLDRRVAIKCLRAELFEKVYRERFKREALLLAKLNHPNIVQIYDFVETEDQLALVMEYVDGQNLQQRMREQVVPFSQRMHWLTQIAQGLAVAHDSGIIHRDLKAENILINKRNSAKISDLGIAKSQDLNATLTDHVAGSYCSMSPEQAMGEELDFKSDLFSLGILAYQMLCGAHPFGDIENKLQLMQRIISHPPISPLKINPNLPPEIAALLGQLLSKNPDNRPDNTHWVAAEFEKLSKLVMDNPFENDDTQMLSSGEHAAASQLEVQKRKPRITQEHPTFSGQKAKLGINRRIIFFANDNKKSIAFVGFLFAAITAIVIWHLQPKQPRYVAVLPPTLTSNGMQESQQELVKGAVYDAIQQSVLQLDGYYLIPRNEIADINADLTKEGMEVIRKASAADEIITAQLQCKTETCSIILSRLMPDTTNEKRLRVQDTKSIDVLTDNYLSVSTMVQNNIGNIYSENVVNEFEKIDEQDYALFLGVNYKYREKGANSEILGILDNLQQRTKSLAVVQTLYREICVELFYETQSDDFLDRLENNIISNTSRNKGVAYLYNLYYLQVTRKKFEEATDTANRLKSLNVSNATIHELYAYEMLAKNDYKTAISFYQKAIALKPTSNNLYFIANAFWFSGNNNLAKDYLNKSLVLSPNYYKSRSLLGVVALSEGDITQAISYLEQAVAQNPNDIDNFSNLGLSYLLNKQYSAAINIFDKALKMNSSDTTLMLNKADAEGLSGNKFLADELYQKVINQSDKVSEDSYVLRNTAQAYAHLSRFSEALTTLQKLEKVDPQNTETFYTAALVHTLAKNNASAMLSLDNTIRNGMSKIWFNFSWFDTLCEDTRFVDLMKSHGEPDRCIPQEI